MNAPSKTNNIFKTLFFITVPLILLGATIIVLIISQGASVTNEGIVGNTGVIRINTDPSNLVYKLYIDGILVETLNNKGTNLEAGEHLLRIEAIGMTGWEKKVTITKGVVNEVFAKFFPESMALAQLTNTNIQQAFISKNGDYVYYVVNDSNFVNDKGIWKMQLSNNNLLFLNNAYTTTKLSELDAKISPIITKNNYDLLPSPDNSKVILIDKETKQAYLVATQILNQSPVITDLNSMVGFTPEKITWFRNSNSVLIQDKHALFEYNLISNVATLIKYSPVNELVYAANNDQVIFFDTATKSFKSYKNDAAATINLHGLIIPESVSNIYIPINDNRFFAIKSAESYQLIDTEKLVSKTLITSDFALQLQSADGLGYIFTNNVGLATAISIKENLGLGVLEVKSTNTTISLTTNDKLLYTPQSSYLLHLDSVAGKLFTLDKDANNQLVLIESKNVKGPFNFDINASNLIIVMQDETTTGSVTTPRNNLYRLSLLKTN